MATRSFDVLIIGGLGHVGLPLGIMLADAGLRVCLYDVDEEKKKIIKEGRMPFIEYDAEPILQRVLGKTLYLADGLQDISRSTFVVVTIGTPVDEYLNPRTRPLFDLAREISPFLCPHHRLILRSTIYPGTTRALNEFFKRHGKDVHLAYCPERIAQGYAIRELVRLPQVISGFSEEAVEGADDLFRRLGVETIRVDVLEAELTKLFSNAWRYIQFAIANQFYMIASEHGASYERIYRAMTYNYDRAQDFPRPGFAAGPCLLKDTLQLAAFYGNHFQLGHAAMMVNEGLPNFIVEHLIRERGVRLSGATVGILGMAFKAEIDDVRDSLSYKLAKILRFHGAEVLCSDEYARDDSFVTADQLLDQSSVVIVGVPHSSYRGLVMPAGKEVVDLWGVTGASGPGGGGVLA